MKKFLRRTFEDTKSRSFHIANDFFALLTIISIISLVLETVPTFSNYSLIFKVTEWIAVILFTVEYLCRLFVSRPAWKYPTSFFGLIDLVAILPTYFGMGNFVFLKSARALRIIRLLRMLRLAKVARSGMTDKKKHSVLSLNILIYFSTLLLALIFSGTAMYLVEGHKEAFISIPAGMWWALKVFIGGITVSQPTTGLGEIFLVSTRFIGLLLFGLMVGIVGNVLKSFLFEDKKNTARR